MSTRYQKPFTIPEGFPALLKAFTREILRNQPANIYEFGARYFADLVDESKKSTASSSRTPPVDYAASPTIQQQTDPEDQSGNGYSVEDTIVNMFLSIDTEQTGVINRADFELVLQDNRWGLSDRQVMQIIAEVCDDSSDVVHYPEVVPLMVEAVQAITVS